MYFVTLTYISGEPGVPTPDEWLIEELADGDDVGADPSMLSYGMCFIHKILSESMVPYVSLCKT